MGLVKDVFQIRLVCHLVSPDFKTPCLLRLAEPSRSSACVPLPGGLSRDVDTFFYKREKNKIVFYDSIGVQIHRIQAGVITTGGSLKGPKPFPYAPKSILAPDTVSAEPSGEVGLGWAFSDHKPPPFPLPGRASIAWARKLAQNFPGNSVPSVESHLEFTPRAPTPVLSALFWKAGARGPGGAYQNHVTPTMAIDN